MLKAVWNKYGIQGCFKGPPEGTRNSGIVLRAVRITCNSGLFKGYAEYTWNSGMILRVSEIYIEF